MRSLGSIEKISPSLLFSFCHLFHISYGGFIFQSTFHLRPRLGSKFQNQDKNWLDTKVGYQGWVPSSETIPPSFLQLPAACIPSQVNLDAQTTEFWNTNKLLNFGLLTEGFVGKVGVLSADRWLTSQKKFLYFDSSHQSAFAFWYQEWRPCNVHAKHIRRLKPRR